MSEERLARLEIEVSNLRGMITDLERQVADFEARFAGINQRQENAASATRIGVARKADIQPPRPKPQP